ncbi:hypothetical protein D1867_03460 [Acidianus infernus]|uniref:5,10-methylenetetrahydrofolate reductase n=1 Tax=Acidianus infernus TaxID=12915 RepID=A0A6A9QDC0_ACIIN|nr:hypothetical protein [Acidianus infernus]MUM64325.1 hypothetical protein [Acidianus infernus]
MQLLAEVHPKTKIEKIKKEIQDLSSFDGFDIPDSPLGLPSVKPTSIAALIREKYEHKRIIINQRLLDVNELYVHSLSLTAKAFNLNIAFTKGDKPKIGKEVGYLSSEEAVNIAKGYGVSSGMMISLRKSRTEILARLESNADFYLALHFYGVESIKGLEESFPKIIPYIIVKTEKNKEILSNISQPSFEGSKVRDLLYELESVGIKSVLISSPGDLNYLANFKF